MMRVVSFLIVLALAFLLRVWGLDRVPPELFGDEVDVGYHAYSLLNTGRDYYGQFLPTYIHSFSEWRAPLLMYVTVPFVAIFGLNEWGVRFSSVIMGVLSVWLVYLLVLKQFKRQELGIMNYELRKSWFPAGLGLLSALLLAISPWHLQYSRAAFEVSLLLALLLGGTLAFVVGLRRGRLLVLSAVLFALTFYTYSTANLFTPLLILLLLFVYRGGVKSLALGKKILPLVVFVVLSLPIAYHILFGSAAERFGKFSVFSDTELVDQINIRRTDAGGGLGEALVHNKPLSWGKKIASNYLTAFSPKFLFIDGDVIFRHSVHEVGQLYWIQLPFLLLGIFWLVKRRDKFGLFWLGWLLLAPIPSSLTRDGEIHATRLILMLPALVIISAVGLGVFLQVKFRWFDNRVVFGVVSVLLAVQFGLYLHRYYVHYPRESWRWWHYGYKEALQFMKDKEGDYEVVAFNNTYEPVLGRFLFWWQYPADKFLGEFTGDVGSKDVLPGFDGFSLGERYYFGSVREQEGKIEKFLTPQTLYLVSQRDDVGGDWDWEKSSPGGVRVLKTVRSPYGEPIFYVVTGR